MASSVPVQVVAVLLLACASTLRGYAFPIPSINYTIDSISGLEFSSCNPTVIVTGVDSQAGKALRNVSPYIFGGTTLRACLSSPGSTHTLLLQPSAFSQGFNAEIVVEETRSCPLVRVTRKDAATNPFVAHGSLTIMCSPAAASPPSSTGTPQALLAGPVQVSVIISVVEKIPVPIPATTICEPLPAVVLSPKSADVGAEVTGSFVIPQLQSAVGYVTPQTTVIFTGFSPSTVAPPGLLACELAISGKRCVPVAIGDAIGDADFFTVVAASGSEALKLIVKQVSVEGGASCQREMQLVVDGSPVGVAPRVDVSIPPAMGTSVWNIEPSKDVAGTLITSIGGGPGAELSLKFGSIGRAIVAQGKTFECASIQLCSEEGVCSPNVTQDVPSVEKVAARISFKTAACMVTVAVTPISSLGAQPPTIIVISSSELEPRKTSVINETANVDISSFLAVPSVFADGSAIAVNQLGGLGKGLFTVLSGPCKLALSSEANAGNQVEGNWTSTLQVRFTVGSVKPCKCEIGFVAELGFGGQGEIWLVSPPETSTQPTTETVSTTTADPTTTTTDSTTTAVEPTTTTSDLTTTTTDSTTTAVEPTTTTADLTTTTTDSTTTAAEPTTTTSDLTTTTTDPTTTAAEPTTTTADPTTTSPLLQTTETTSHGTTTTTAPKDDNGSAPLTFSPLHWMQSHFLQVVAFVFVCVMLYFFKDQLWNIVRRQMGGYEDLDDLNRNNDPPTHIITTSNQPGDGSLQAHGEAIFAGPNVQWRSSSSPSSRPVTPQRKGTNLRRSAPPSDDVHDHAAVDMTSVPHPNPQSAAEATTDDEDFDNFFGKGSAETSGTQGSGGVLLPPTAPVTVHKTILKPGTLKPGSSTADNNTSRPSSTLRRGGGLQLTASTTKPPLKPTGKKTAVKLGGRLSSLKAAAKEDDNFLENFYDAQPQRAAEAAPPKPPSAPPQPATGWGDDDDWEN